VRSLVVRQYWPNSGKKPYGKGRERTELLVNSDQNLVKGGRPQMPDRAVKLKYVAMLILRMAGPAVAQDSAGQQLSAREQLQRIHRPQSIYQELAHLTKDLELTTKQQQQILPLLQEHQDKIQALIDKNPKASRQELAPQVHAVSDETHRQIHDLLTGHQKDLEKAMREREHREEESRRPDLTRSRDAQRSSGSKKYSNPCPGSSLLAQQDRGIDGERALRWNPRSY
jgi:hypothetical protein